MEARPRVPLCDTKRQYQALAGPIDAAVQRVLARGVYIHGPEHQEFEREFAEYCEVRYAVACASGTDALELALRAAGIGPGDEVATVANAGGYTTTAARLVGATLVYVDVDERLTMDPASLARAIGPRTRAIVVTHLYGWLAAMPEILGVADRAGAIVIEDCAQAHGAMRDGRRAGSFGRMATFSFYPTKNLGACGDGGAVASDDKALAERLRVLRQYGWREKYHATTPGGRNSRMDELQAAILRVKLPRLDAWNARRREIVARYAEAARGTELAMVHSPGQEYVAHLAVARHPDREGFRRRLAEAGIDTAVHFPVLDHHQPALALEPDCWRSVDLARSEAAVREIVTLPCHAEMRDDEIARVCGSLRRIARAA